MRTITNISLWIVRVAGTLQLVLGALFWAGRAYTYVPLHIISGTVIVLTLWMLAVLALVVRTRRGLAVFGLVWGLALPVLGLWQATLLVGPLHWIVRVVHLLMGFSAMGVAGMLGGAILAALPARVRRSDLESGPAVASRAP